MYYTKDLTCISFRPNALKYLFRPFSPAVALSLSFRTKFRLQAIAPNYHFYSQPTAITNAATAINTPDWYLVPSLTIIVG